MPAKTKTKYPKSSAAAKRRRAGAEVLASATEMSADNLVALVFDAMTGDAIDLLSRFAATRLPKGTESWETVETSISAANVFAARKLVEELRPGWLKSRVPPIKAPRRKPKARSK